MNVLGRDHVIEHAQTKSLLRFEQPVEITASITRKLEQKLSLMAAVGNVPDVTGQEVTIGARHRLFKLKKRVPRSQPMPFILCSVVKSTACAGPTQSTILHNRLSWSDPKHNPSS